MKKLSSNFYQVIFILAIIMIYSCNSKNGSNSGTTSGQIAQVDSATVVNNNMQPDMDAARLQIDQLKTQIASLDSIVAGRGMTIKNLQIEMKRYKTRSKNYASKLKKAEELISRLHGDAKGYADNIYVLKNDRDNIARQRDSIVQQYLSLKELASVLHASNIHMVALKVKHSGKEKRTGKARKVKILRVTFDIDENRIAENGTKKLYLVIKGPDGNILNNSYGSGTITTAAGQHTQYSVEKDISLHKNEALGNVITDWRQNEGVAYKRGEYDIDIYNGGYEIGTGRVFLN